ncbi:hypothetical protein Ddye_023006 [Dipteronia dyeriana]|uniref:Uncharacterized protein n=1 Tax=Dipteronia dyeriana TaxID=168575 RepID=A0AAD9TT39_9ROSI|nr:hypothetical protein Ddye_023006 [Dipteronia dyeriana]
MSPLLRHYATTVTIEAKTQNQDAAILASLQADRDFSIEEPIVAMCRPRTSSCDMCQISKDDSDEDEDVEWWEQLRVSVKNSPKISEFFLTNLLATMDMMKKISFTVLVVAATMSTVAVASRDVLAPAPAPAETTSGASAAVGSLVGASLMSLVALYLQ